MWLETQYICEQVIMNAFLLNCQDDSTAVSGATNLPDAMLPTCSVR